MTCQAVSAVTRCSDVTRSPYSKFALLPDQQVHPRDLPHPLSLPTPGLSHSSPLPDVRSCIYVSKVCLPSNGSWGGDCQGHSHVLRAQNIPGT